MAAMICISQFLLLVALHSSQFENELSGSVWERREGNFSQFFNHNFLSVNETSQQFAIYLNRYARKLLVSDSVGQQNVVTDFK